MIHALRKPLLIFRERPFGLVSVILLSFLLGGLGATPVLALDLTYRCRADPDTVFRVVSQIAKGMTDWRSLHTTKSQRTMRAVVRNWRNFSVPVWVEVRPVAEEDPGMVTELHVLWEQGMEPLNYPDLNPFITVFVRQQDTLELGCKRTGIDVGL